MPIRPIITPENPVLRRKARALDPKELKSTEIQRLIDDMVETMREAPGVGLAGPQVAQPIRLAVIEYAPGSEDLPEDADPPEPKLYVIVNPEITARSEALVNGVEGCLSIPRYAGHVMRHKEVTIKALNRQGRPIKIKASGWLARIFQHEIDHLDGVLFIDKALKTWRTTEDEHVQAE
jgi:peptide deformylase